MEIKCMNDYKKGRRRNVGANSANKRSNIATTMAYDGPRKQTKKGATKIEGVRGPQHKVDTVNTRATM